MDPRQRITVNGRIAELGQKVSAADDIRLDGRPIKARATAAAQVFIFNRSPGDPLRESTRRARRADRAAAQDRRQTFHRGEPDARHRRGLELVTSDGALAAKLQTRRSQSCRANSSVRVKALLGPDQIAGVESGKLDRPVRNEHRIAEQQ